MKISERNQEILKLAGQNNTLEFMGQRFGLTRERVRQIIEKYGSEDLKQYRTDRRKHNCLRCGVLSSIAANGLCKECIEIIKVENSKYWNVKYKLMRCKDCGSDKKLHYAQGRCSSCYEKYLYKYHPGRKERVNKANKKWAKNNPEAMKIISKRTYNTLKNDPVRWAKYLAQNKERRLKKLTK